ncbi:MAG TPA: hypothetical protein VHU84_12295 [Lacipirellulaceae bacterium]|jgi:predicted dehydrogenase|nr:hypothetical protein [Lacipirellulaceae bacterium]
MKLAILGTDSDILHLAAAARAESYEIIWLGDVRPEDATAIGQFVTDREDRAPQWELLLDRATVDGVLVGQGTASAELRAEQLKRLAAEAVSLLTVHPIFNSVLPYYEIDMARRETGAIIQHFNPVAENPATSQLADWIAHGHPTIGAIHQLTCERQIATAARENVLDALARDIELLTAIAGDIRRVSAIGPASLESSFASLQVQMSSTRLSSLRWSVTAAVSHNAGLQCALQGEHGIVTLRNLPTPQSDRQTWQLETLVGDQKVVSTLEAPDPATTAIRKFSEAVLSKQSTRSTWESATRAMEVVDAVELSLQKGRTIEVFQQQLTEQLAFRGTMAAFGCGLLLIVFFAVIVVAVLGGAEGIVKEKIAPAWPLLMLAVLAFFLLLQAIPMLAQKSKRPADQSARKE